MDATSRACDGAGVAAPTRLKKRTGTSKYDFIKVKVWLGEDLDHYYILSRFLICRMLTVTRIPYIKAVKIALETKKYLVDHNLHDVTQAKLEEVLFSIVRSKGFDEAYIDCYRMVTQFYQSRQPLVVIICGAAWTGKSTLAQQLASRINIPNVMQTDIIYELLRSGPDSPLHSAPLWARPGLAGGRCCDAALVREFRREARVVREGMEGDLIKTLSDGKPIIIEGFHLDPGLYIPDFGSRGLIMLPARPTAALTAAAAVAAGRGLHAAAAAGRSPGSSPLAGRGAARYGRSQTLPQQRGTAAAVGGAGAVSVEQLHELTPQQQGEQAAGQLQQLQQQQQQHMMLGQSCKRSMSDAAAEVSVSAAGPLSPGSLTAPGGSSVSAETALALLRRGAAADLPQGEQQQQQQDLQQHQQPQRLLRVSEEPGQPQQQVSSLPPLPPLRLRRPDVSTTQINGFKQGNSPRSSSSSSVQQFLPGAPSSVGVGSSSVQQQSVEGRQRMGTPFADAAVAAAGAAASVAGCTPAAEAAAAGDGGRDSNWPTDSLFSGLDELPVVMTGEEVQVCAAAAEAAALHQHRQEQQVHSQLQQQLAQQRGRGGPLPDSPFSPISDASSFGVGGGSPCCISQEHSTTEVVSRVCSCASLGSPALTLSQEASGVDVWSPAAAGTAAAAAAPAAGADGPGCGAAMCRQLSSGGLRAGGLRVRGSAGSGSGRHLQQLPEEQEACAPPPPQQQQLQQQQHGLLPAGGPDVRQLRPAAASAPASLCGGSPGQPQPVPAAAPDAPSQPASATRVSADSCVVHDTVEGSQQQQQQRGDSLGAPSKAAAEPEPVGKPLFVPILLYMDEPDHVLMADEALSHLWAGAAAGDSSAAAAATAADGIGSCMHAVGPGGEGGAQGGGGGVQGAGAQHQQQHQQQQGGAESVGEALRRVRLLQEYLCAYEAQGLPVVKVSYGAFGEALDKLHEYVLQCIKVAMQSRVAVLHQQQGV